MTSVEKLTTTESSAIGGSRDWLRIISIVLVVIALGISGYLSYVKLVNVPTVCVQGSVFNCEVVQNSIYSRIFNTPIAWMGFATNLVIMALLLLENRIPFLQDNGAMIEFGIILFAFLFSVWLVYVQFFRLQALCIWCISHEAVITILFGVTIIRLKRSLS